MTLPKEDKENEEPENSGEPSSSSGLHEGDAQQTPPLPLIEDMDLLNPEEDDDDDDNATILYDPSSEVAADEADWTYLSWTEKVMSNSSSFSLMEIEEPHAYGCFRTSMSLAATGPAKRKKARAEATKTDIRQFSKQFHQAKLEEMKSWKDNEVYELVDTRKFQPKNCVAGRWVLTVKRDSDGFFPKV